MGSSISSSKDLSQSTCAKQYTHRYYDSALSAVWLCRSKAESLEPGREQVLLSVPSGLSPVISRSVHDTMNTLQETNEQMNRLHVTVKAKQGHFADDKL